MGLVSPQHTEVLAYNETELNISSDSLTPSDSEPRVSTPVSREISQNSTDSKKRDRPRRKARRHSSEIEAEVWKGRAHERLKLVQNGYNNLAIICTFLAGVQAAILGVTSTQTGVAAQIVNGFFFAGLVADIGAAVLSAASQRWFEMIRPDEAEHAFDYLQETHSGTRSDEIEQIVVGEKTNSLSSQTENVAGKERPEEADHVNGAASPSATWTTLKRYCSIERWVLLALKTPLNAALLGFGFMLAGVMLWVWSHEALVANVLCTVLCALVVILLPSFRIPHNRRETLRLFKLQRAAG
ncbi:hypothetical protein F5887DRAFT_985412 [Amanita rubescens]|nr:hypothetical protein F5887DRAFT_985412 [Amanita rubescens]